MGRRARYKDQDWGIFLQKTALLGTGRILSARKLAIRRKGFRDRWSLTTTRSLKENQRYNICKCYKRYLIFHNVSLLCKYLSVTFTFRERGVFSLIISNSKIKQSSLWFHLFVFDLIWYKTMFVFEMILYATIGI